ncbi:PPE family protein PPE15 [Mycobacterium simulans]|uniref:PPE family protein n=1 Tax=Mycobacterium simulans TaxID=627089 RepID=UPI00174A3631|nr:PPE domain-containing protein [Mycobacterium simulans]SON62398.1 PPE family protein PPE15 [Mycobacterium simulans]
MDFGALPPEINSALMYAGAGAAPLLAAAAAWNGLAVELSTAAASFESVVTRLSTEQWMGPASLSMVAAAQPFVAWLTDTAESSALAAAQAMASAAAFETAFAMTVPPAEVAANRAQLAALIETNILGQNAEAIAATEASYGEMWAQDASAMYGYAASSAIAGRLDPLTKPSHITNPAGIANQAAAVGQAAATGSAQQVALSNLISNVPDAVVSLASPVAATTDAAGLDAVVQADFSKSVEYAWHGLSGGIADFSMASVSNSVFIDSADTAGTISQAVARAAPAAGTGHPITPRVIARPALSAGLGDASAVGRLSVPASWSTAAPAATSGTALDGTGWAVPEDDGPMAAMPPAPGAAVAADGRVGAGPRYGVKPTVMPKRGLF